MASYKYTLTSATTDVADVTEKDTFTLTVSDGTATSAEASIVIDIVDDEPNAVDDSGYTVIEDDAAANVVLGNVLDNDVHANGQPGADAPKAFVGWGASAADAAAIAELNSYGTLVQNPTTGAWSYTLDNGKAATQALGASFSKDFALTYTMKDGDGDEKSATLTITVKGANDGPAVTVDPGTPDGANGQVLELGLSTGSTAGTGHVAEGTFTLSDPDGLASLVSVTINGDTILIADLVGSTIDGAHGTLEITAYDAATGVASYEYTLTSATTDVADVTEKDTFTLTVSDGTATSAEASIVIDIVDDEPNAVDDSGYTVIEDDAAANVVSGNVLDNDVHANGQPGADAPKAFVGWGQALPMRRRSPS